MNDGFRFKKRLPAYISKISDFEDTLIAEDKEFDRIENLLNDFTLSFTIDSIKYSSNPNFYLTKYEKDYGLSHFGTIDERIARLKIKILGKKVTTEQVVLEVCKIYGSPAKFIERYREYGFTLILHLKDKLDLGRVSSALREIVPAHLDFDLNVGIFNFLKIKAQYGLDGYLQYLCGEHLCSDIPYNDKVGYRNDINISIKTGNYDNHNEYSYAGNFKYAGEINDFAALEEINIQDVSKYDIIYIFDNEDWKEEWCFQKNA